MTVDELSERMKPLAKSFISNLEANGIAYVITDTIRSLDKQIAYFAQGRAPLEIVNLLRRKASLAPIGMKDNTYTITNCDGIDTQSPHQRGDAMDVVPRGQNGPIWPPPTDPRWNVIALLGKAVGLEWGGDWPDFRDMPHYQVKGA